MTMRIAKYPPIAGVGLDQHGRLPGYFPAPVPPLPPTPLVPQTFWAVIVAIPTLVSVLTGKFSLVSVVTEGMGDILWGHDWGPGQVHLPIPPAPPLVTPSLSVLLVGSTTKYFLPSFALKEAQDGAISGGSGPVAVSLPLFIILTQQCQDSACALGFVGPSSICYQQVSVRWVGFNWGDVLAGIITMAADALAALVLSKFGGQIFKNTTWDDQLLGGLASSITGIFSNWAGLIPATGLAIGSGTLAGVLGLAFESSTPVALLAPIIGVLGGAFGSWVGDNFEPHGGDWGPKPDDGSTSAAEPTADAAGGSGAGGADGGTPPDHDAGTGDGGMDAGTSEPDVGTGTGDGGMDGGTDGGTSEPDAGADSSDDEVCEPDGGPQASYPDDDAGASSSEPPDEGVPDADAPDDEPNTSHPDDEPNASHPDDEPNASYPDDDAGAGSSEPPDAGVPDAAPPDDEPNASYPDDEPNQSGG